jgi:hypothetical protein
MSVDRFQNVMDQTVSVNLNLVTSLEEVTGAVDEGGNGVAFGGQDSFFPVRKLIAAEINDDEHMNHLNSHGGDCKHGFRDVSERRVYYHFSFLPVLSDGCLFSMRFGYRPVI